MKTHKLKCWPDPFQAILVGAKAYEVRREDDRRFEVGDQLELLEVVPVVTDGLDSTEATGRRLIVLITHVTRAAGPLMLIADGALGKSTIRPVPMAAMSIRLLDAYSVARGDVR